MLNAQRRFGNPISSFFGGASLSGEAKRGQNIEGDWANEPPNPRQAPGAIARQTYRPNRNVGLLPSPPSTAPTTIAAALLCTVTNCAATVLSAAFVD